MERAKYTMNGDGKKSIGENLSALIKSVVSASVSHPEIWSYQRLCLHMVMRQRHMCM